MVSLLGFSLPGLGQSGKQWLPLACVAQVLREMYPGREHIIRDVVDSDGHNGGFKLPENPKYDSKVTDKDSGARLIDLSKQSSTKPKRMCPA